MEIATEILNQLGGQRFILMTGAKNLVGGKDHLQFKIGRNASKANTVYIKLEDNDTYTVKFFRYARMELKELKKYSGVYCNMLTSIFTSYTGLYTSL